MNTVYFSDIPRLFTAIAEWGACVVFIQNCPRRFHGPRLWLLLGIGLAVQCTFLQLTDKLPLAFWFPCMGVAVGFMFLLVAACCAISLLCAAHFTACAFLTAEFAASLEWQLYSYACYHMNFTLGSWGTRAVSFVFLVAVYTLVFVSAYYIRSQQKDTLNSLCVQVRELWPSCIISASCFLLSNLSFVSHNIPFTGSALDQIHNIRTLVDLAGTAILYGYHAQRSELYKQRELDAIQSILQNQYVQYQQSRESIDLINRKYHDLKHQIAVLRAEQDPQRRTSFLDGMEEEIAIYEAQNKTGNSVLDTVLTGKSLYCARHNIEMTCMADGASLHFMNVMDICSIFGNILDNAIECELEIKDKAKRLIRLAIYSRKNFLVIQCENYCEEAVQLQNGMPVSTKDDGDYHGFGIKSICYIVDQYAGTVTIHNQDSWFKINIVIPIPEA